MTKSRNFSDVPENLQLQTLINKLKIIRNLLLYKADLRSISMEVERVINNSSTIFISLDAFEAEIRLAREELYTASNALEKSDRMSNMRLFYKSLNNCGQHINQALQLVVDNP